LRKFAFASILIYIVTHIKKVLLYREISYFKTLYKQANMPTKRKLTTEQLQLNEERKKTKRQIMTTTNDDAMELFTIDDDYVEFAMSQITPEQISTMEKEHEEKVSMEKKQANMPTKRKLTTEQLQLNEERKFIPCGRGFGELNIVIDENI